MNTKNQAIITAFTKNFWADFLIAYDSIKRVTDTTIYVVPLDFDDEHIELLKPLDVQIVTLDAPEVKKMKLTFYDRWVQWSKPYIIKRLAMMLEESSLLWLDVDLVVLENPDCIFEKIEQDFVVINDYFAPKSCLNDKELYEEYQVSVQPHQEEIAINSGVVGFKKPRDMYIINKWLENTVKVETNPNLMRYIRLYDQGVLLWAMHDLRIIDKALPYSLWNHKAIRNCYEYSTPSELKVRSNFKWPVPKMPRMGGDIIEEVKLDNPGVTIAHFAGLPKLSDLCELNNKHAVQYVSAKFKSHKRSRLFCVGMERCGTHTIAEILRRGSMHESWVRHEFDPVLAKEVELKWIGEKYLTPTLNKRMEIYNRNDVFLMSEVNHRLGFLIPEILSCVDDPKFLMMLRDPITLVRSRLRNYSIWARDIDDLPQIYLNGLKSVGEEFENGSVDQNVHRIKPRSGSKGWSLAKLHAWEIETTLRTTLSELRKLPPDMYSVIWLENLGSSLGKIENLIHGKLNMPECKKWVDYRFGASLSLPDDTSKWIEEQVTEFREVYLCGILDIFREFSMIPPFRTYI